jgi:biotin operon repressor
MPELAFASWLRNAAAALCGRYGSVTRQAEQAGCSRQTVYEHGRQLREELASVEQLRAEAARLRAERDALQEQLRQAVLIGTEQLRRFAVTSQALGASLRQAEELLGTLLPADRVPDHATLGRWTQAAGRRAGRVLAQLDPLSAPAVRTLCADEIFFGGWPPSSPWSRRA